MSAVGLHGSSSFCSDSNKVLPSYKPTNLNLIQKRNFIKSHTHLFTM